MNTRTHTHTRTRTRTQTYIHTREHMHNYAQSCTRHQLHQLFEPHDVLGNSCARHKPLIFITKIICRVPHNILPVPYSIDTMLALPTNSQQR